MIVRLKTMAPWNNVTLNDGFIITKDWKDYNKQETLKPILKYVEYKEEILVDYSALSKADLVTVATEKGIDVVNMTKAKIIEALNGIK